MAVTATLCAILVLAAILWSFVDKWKNQVLKRPPGPFKIPIMGHLLYLAPSLLDPVKLNIKWKFAVDLMEKYYQPPYIFIHWLSMQYGPLTNLKFGVNNSIIVSSAEYAREMHCREEFVDRFADGWMLDRQFGQQLGLIFNNGRPYREIKHFTVKNLKDFGFGKKQNMETAVEDELLDFLHYFDDGILHGKPNTIKMEHLFTLPVLNILWIMVAGTRFSYDDDKLHRLIRTVDEITKTHDIGGNILMAFPYLRFLFPEATGHAHQLRLYAKLHEFFRDIMQSRLAENDFDSESPRDFTDIFILEMNKRRKVNGNDSQIFTEEQFIMVCLDLFTAGAETTANTLDFAMLYLMMNPRVQKKVQTEIDEVLGSNRLPKLKDRQLMPYTEATLLETQRMCNVIPLVHRVVTADATLGPYNIQKGDVMVMNTYSIHMDEKVWGDPHTFRPERFLDENGNINNLTSFMPFGMGKRVCMGETLARHTMFTFMTAMMQRYSLMPAEKHEIPEIKPAKGYTLNPEPFYTYVTPRS